MMHQPQQKQCFTVGYGNFPIDRFITFLQNVSIDVIIDVRSSPYSRFNPLFNRENLEISVSLSDIGYRYLGDKIGGRYTDPGLLFPDGTVNYQKVQNTEKFQEGIKELRFFSRFRIVRNYQKNQLSSVWHNSGVMKSKLSKYERVFGLTFCSSYIKY